MTPIASVARLHLSERLAEVIRRVVKESSMPALLIRHKVTDFATWKPVFERHAATRRAHGCQESRLFRSADDPNETLILLVWDDLARARLFALSDDFREALTLGGVADEPDLWFLHESEEPSLA